MTTRPPDQVRPVDLGERTVVETDGGQEFSCVLLDDGAVRCWGFQTLGPVIGVPSSGDQRIGDDEEPTTIPAVDLGGRATAIAAGNAHVCALLEDGSVRCWGEARFGQLGYGNVEDIGDDETPAQAGAVPVGGAVVAITAGGNHTCAILDTGDVRCWGERDAITGRGASVATPTTTPNVGDDELASAGPIADLGGADAIAVSAGGIATCALVTGGDVWCWGSGDGANNSTGIGRAIFDPTEMDLGGRTAASLSVGNEHACVLFDDGQLYCWGENDKGQLGYGNTDEIGDGGIGTPESPLSGGPVDVGAGRTVLTVSAGADTTCVILDNLTVRCWGTGPIVGQGISTENTVGDDEVPADVPVINYNGTAAYTPLARRPASSTPAHRSRHRQGQPIGQDSQPVTRSTSRSPDSVACPTPVSTPSCST